MKKELFSKHPQIPFILIMQNASPEWERKQGEEDTEKGRASMSNTLTMPGRFAILLGR